MKYPYHTSDKLIKMNMFSAPKSNKQNLSITNWISNCNSIFNKKLLSLIFVLFGTIGTAFGHAVQIAYGFSPAGDLRIYIEHWHGK